MDDLIEQLRSGDKNSIKQVYLDFYEKCKWAVLKNGGDDEDAQETFQQALFSLLEKVQDQSFKVKALDNYLFRTCTFLWYATKRKRQRVSLTDTFSDEVEEVSYDESSEHRLTQKDKMYQALNEINETCRKLLELFFFEKLSDVEIAPIMNFAPNYVRVKRSRCIMELRKMV
ncbi:MAG: sigma-70 family RNA polymerase sigma factor [Bacteroidota bacterium]